MTKWQSFLESIRTYKAPEVVLCSTCGHTIPDPIGARGQATKYCNDECKWASNRERKREYVKRQKAKRRAACL